jgi:hypothetical protein
MPDQEQSGLPSWLACKEDFSPKKAPIKGAFFIGMVGAATVKYK